MNIKVITFTILGFIGGVIGCFFLRVVDIGLRQYLSQYHLDWIVEAVIDVGIVVLIFNYLRKKWTSHTYSKGL